MKKLDVGEIHNTKGKKKLLTFPWKEISCEKRDVQFNNIMFVTGMCLLRTGSDVGLLCLR
jgi:hypothetical protein